MFTSQEELCFVLSFRLGQPERLSETRVTRPFLACAARLEPLQRRGAEAETPLLVCGALESARCNDLRFLERGEEEAWRHCLLKNLSEDDVRLFVFLQRVPSLASDYFSFVP